MINARCGKIKSSNSKPFTEKSVKQHERDCQHCIALLKQDGVYQENHEGQAPSIEIIPSRYYSNYFDDEIPDGAYWALRSENPYI